MAQIAAALNSSGPLEQSLLSDLSRKSLKAYLRDSPDPPPLEQVEKLWQKLIQSVNNSQGREQYLTAACNAVSVFLVTSSTSQSEGIRFFPFSRSVWSDGYQCAQKAFKKGKTKPALQVLETLCHLLNEHSDLHAASTILHQVIKDLLKVILIGDLPHHVKVSCITLSCFMRKTSIAPKMPHLAMDCISEEESAWTKHLRQHNCHPEDLSLVEGDHKAVILALLMAIKDLETRSAALKLLTLICTRNSSNSNSEDLFMSAALTIKLYLDRNSDLLGDFTDNVFPVVLDDPARWQMFVNFLRPNFVAGESELLQYLSVLRVGRLSRFIAEEDLEELLMPITEQNGTGPGPQQASHSMFLQLLQASSGAVRTHAYSLLTTAPATTTTISPNALQCVAKAWKYIHDDNDAHERGEVLSITRRLLKRLDSGLTGRKPNESDQKCTDPASMPNHNLRFLEQLVCLLRQELRPGISYPRHILALQTIQIFLSSPSSGLVVLQPLCKPLLSLVLDPFEDVRSISTEICGRLFRRPDCASQKSLVRVAAKQVEVLSAMTSRHDQADAAGRLYFLAQTIEDSESVSSISVERLNFYTSNATALAPGSAFPLHALLLGATHCVSSWMFADKKFSPSQGNEIYRVCCRIWELVQGQLCMDSPETATAESEKSTVGPKDLLAYSWRALRDSNLLLQAMLRAFEVKYGILEEVGSLCIEQLTMLRHRGAFSTVAQTFTLCCELARSSADASCKQLPASWYRIAVEEIGKQASKLTRRSAGLPALINAVLSPNDPDFFKMVMEDLKSKAADPVATGAADGQEVELPQVHALNCIKDIIHNSRFRTVNEQYLGELIKLGANSLSSSIWAIRNSGLMLLKACLVRFEPNGSPTTSMRGDLPVQSTRQEPLQVVISLLERDTLVEHSSADQSKGGSDNHPRPLANSISRSESIFAALDLVRYVGNATHKSSQLWDLLHYQLKSHIWAIRDHAARVLVDRAELEENLLVPLSICPLPSGCSENELHGILLFFRYCLQSQRQYYSDEDLDDCLEYPSEMLHALAPRINACSSPFTKAAILDIVNDSLSFALSTGYILTDLDLNLSKVQNACRGTRNAYCHGRYLLNRILFYIATGSEFADRKLVRMGEADLEALLDNIRPYPDEIRYIVERLGAIEVQNATAQARLLDFLSRVSMEISTTDVRASTLTVLVDILEGNEQMATHFCGASMDMTRATMDVFLLHNRVSDRELWNTTLRIWAFFTRAHVELNDELSQPAMKSVYANIKRLQNHLHVAAQDATEFPTRLSAVLALRTCAPLVVLLGKRQGGCFMPLAMSALALLYDQLNDDDEDVRRIAELSATKVLDSWRGEEGYQPGKTLSSLASREAIVELMLEPAEKLTSDKQAAVSRIAIVRIIGNCAGQSGILEESVKKALEISVNDILQYIHKSLNDLFAEERQNLNIDDLDEVAKWTRVVRQCGLHLTSDELELFTTWVSDGMDQITMALENSDERKHFPFWPTYYSEILILFVRVISLASVLTELLNRVDPEGRSGSLVTKLETLKMACMEREVHERVMMAFDAGK